jgi:hypothetical protein
VEIHLHSPLYYNFACETPTINVIGVESAGTPSYLELIDKKVLENTDSFLRLGIAERISTPWQEFSMRSTVQTSGRISSTSLK